VDLDAAAQRQHEAAMGSAAPAAHGLVQILPAASAGPERREEPPPSPTIQAG